MPFSSFIIMTDLYCLYVHSLVTRARFLKVFSFLEVQQILNGTLNAYGQCLDWVLCGIQASVHKQAEWEA